jgi:hypothetical protein
VKAIQLKSSVSTPASEVGKGAFFIYHFLFFIWSLKKKTSPEGRHASFKQMAGFRNK